MQSSLYIAYPFFFRCVVCGRAARQAVATTTSFARRKFRHRPSPGRRACRPWRSCWKFPWPRRPRLATPMHPTYVWCLCAPCQWVSLRLLSLCPIRSHITNHRLHLWYQVGDLRMTKHGRLRRFNGKYWVYNCIVTGCTKVPSFGMVDSHPVHCLNRTPSIDFDFDLIPTFFF